MKTIWCILALSVLLVLGCAESDMPKTTRVNIEIGKPRESTANNVSGSGSNQGSKKAYSGARKTTYTQNYAGTNYEDATK